MSSWAALTAAASTATLASITARRAWHSVWASRETQLTGTKAMWHSTRKRGEGKGGGRGRRKKEWEEQEEEEENSTNSSTSDRKGKNGGETANRITEKKRKKDKGEQRAQVEEE